MQYTQSDEENEEVKVNHTGNKVKPAKKRNGGGPKMKNTSKDSLKQTKLSFSNNKDCKKNIDIKVVNIELIGKKRTSPEDGNQEIGQNIQIE